MCMFINENVTVHPRGLVCIAYNVVFLGQADEGDCNCVSA